MKILVRQLRGTNYVWQDATYVDGEFRIGSKDDSMTISETNILAIKDDNRKGYVVCAHCGEVIKGTPEDIEAHFKAQEDKRNCFECTSLRKYVDKSISAEFTANEDGTYNVKENYIAKLKCGNAYWNSPDINSPQIKEICNFYRCRRYGTHPIKDIFTEYPEPFDKQLTVDVIAKKFEYNGFINGYFEYDLKCRNTVKACVNELGIVDHFIVKHRNHRWIAYYSDTHDILFFTYNGRDYCLERPSDISQAKYEQAKAKIAALYKEEEDK